MSTDPSGARPGDAQEHDVGHPALTRHILIGLAAGLVTGLLLNLVPMPRALFSFAVDGVLFVGGAIFLASLKLLVVPLVFVSLVCGTAALDDLSRLGRLGARTLGLYLFTTAVAIALALVAAIAVEPGAGFDLPTDVTFAAKEAPSLAETLIRIFPTNPIQAMADGNMLQIIVFSILFGVAMTLAGEAGRRTLANFQDWNAVVMRLVALLMRLAPIGVFCLIARVFAEQGVDALRPLFAYFFVVLGVLFVHGGLVYPALLAGLGRLDPRVFFRKIRGAQLVAFSTASSGATIPVTLRATERRLGVANRVASFTIPLGATINMDGTAIMQGVATVFIAQAYGVEIGLNGYLMVVLTATLASIGTAGVPGVGLVMLAMVLRQVNLPVEGIGLIIGIDRLLDMVRTAVNITGDAAVSCIVARSENDLDLEVYADPDAG